MTTVVDNDTCSYCNQNILGDKDTDESDRNDRDRHRQMLMAFPICVDCFEIYSTAKHDEDKDTLRLFNMIRGALSHGPVRTKIIQLRQVLEADVAEKKLQEQERAFKAVVETRLSGQVKLLQTVRDKDEVVAALELEEFLVEHPEYVDFFVVEKKEEKPTCETCIHHDMERGDDDDVEEVCRADQDGYLREALKCPEYKGRGRSPL